VKKLLGLFPKNQRKYYIVISLCTVIILICTYFAIITDQPVLRILEKSDIAMQQLKTYHVSEIITLTPITNYQQENIDLLKSDGNFILPDQAELHVTIPSYPPSRYTMISQSGKTCTLDENTEKWSVTNKSLVFGSDFTDADVIAYLNLSADIEENGYFTDNGYKIENNQKLHYITVSIGNDDMKNFLEDIGKEQHISRSLVIQNSILDYWIDESTYYIRHMKFTFTGTSTGTQENNANSSNSSQTSEPAIQISITFTFSKFNEPVTITVPKGC